jgi:hypothetical protein
LFPIASPSVNSGGKAESCSVDRYREACRSGDRVSLGCRAEGSSYWSTDRYRACWPGCLGHISKSESWHGKRRDESMPKRVGKALHTDVPVENDQGKLSNTSYSFPPAGLLPFRHFPFTINSLALENASFSGCQFLWTVSGQRLSSCLPNCSFGGPFPIPHSFAHCLAGGLLRLKQHEADRRVSHWAAMSSRLHCRLRILRGCVACALSTPFRSSKRVRPCP